MGKLADIIREVNDIVNELNKIYREILVVTGPTPDPYRDYQFKETMPDMLNQLRVQNERLQKAADQIVQQSGMQGAVSYTHLDVYKRQVLMSIVILFLIAMTLYWVINLLDKQYLKLL